MIPHAPESIIEERALDIFDAAWYVEPNRQLALTNVILSFAVTDMVARWLRRTYNLVVVTFFVVVHLMVDFVFRKVLHRQDTVQRVHSTPEIYSLSHIQYKYT